MNTQFLLHNPLKSSSSHWHFFFLLTALQENYFLVGSNQVFRCVPAAAIFPLQPVSSGPLNGIGLQHVIGNVAEMTTSPGVAKGGSFKTSVQGLTLRSRQAYQGPQTWLGFRCVATVRMVRK